MTLPHEHLTPKEYLAFGNDLKNGHPVPNVSLTVTGRFVIPAHWESLPPVPTEFSGDVAARGGRLNFFAAQVRGTGTFIDCKNFVAIAPDSSFSSIHAVRCNLREFNAHCDGHLSFMECPSLASVNVTGNSPGLLACKCHSLSGIHGVFNYVTVDGGADAEEMLFRGSVLNNLTLQRVLFRRLPKAQAGSLHLRECQKLTEIGEAVEARTLEVAHCPELRVLNGKFRQSAEVTNCQALPPSGINARAASGVVLRNTAGHELCTFSRGKASSIKRFLSDYRNAFPDTRPTRVVTAQKD